jgi:hypothetical protein
MAVFSAYDSAECYMLTFLQDGPQVPKMSHYHFPRFNLAELLALIAMIAVVMVCPATFLPACGVVLFVVLVRTGFTLISICLIMVVLGFVFGMLSGYGFLS